jgi:hypothetical protein
MDVSTRLRQPSVTYKLSERDGKVIATAYWQGQLTGVYIEVPDPLPPNQTLLPDALIEQAERIHREIRERAGQQSDQA